MRTSCFLLLILPAAALRGQSGSFVATLGTDTVQVESFVRRGDTVSGTVVTRVPGTRILRWTMAFDHAGHPTHYQSQLTDASGIAIGADGATASFDYLGDSIVKTLSSKSGPVIQRVAAPSGGWPSPSIPYIGVSYLMYEFSLNEARSRVADGSARLFQLYSFASVPAPQPTRAWFPAADSAELDYYGVARSGYRFDPAGHLIRADWTSTTYRYRIVRTAAIDANAVAARWHDADAAGHALGALSPRDSARGTVGASALTVDYSRPSRRGRVLWGEVVKKDSVWRLGADMATHFTTSADLTLGGTTIPAGRYTIWMLYRGDGTAALVVNSKVNVFGTAYDPKGDFVRIPLRWEDNQPDTERLTITAGPTAIAIAWGTVRWSVAATSP